MCGYCAGLEVGKLWGGGARGRHRLGSLRPGVEQTKGQNQAAKEGHQKELDSAGLGW